MIINPKQFLQEITRRVHSIHTDVPVDQDKADLILAALPLRLPEEKMLDWFKRAQKLSTVVNFRYLTDIQRLVADTRETEDALPEISLTTSNQQFRLSVESLPQNKIKLTLGALGLASYEYANCLIGIAAGNSQDQLIAKIRLDAKGKGSDELDNTAANRQALLRPVIALLSEQDNA